MNQPWGRQRFGFEPEINRASSASGSTTACLSCVWRYAKSSRSDPATRFQEILISWKRPHFLHPNGYNEMEREICTEDPGGGKPVPLEPIGRRGGSGTTRGPRFTRKRRLGA